MLRVKVRGPGWRPRAAAVCAAAVVAFLLALSVGALSCDKGGRSDRRAAKKPAARKAPTPTVRLLAEHTFRTKKDVRMKAAIREDGAVAAIGTFEEIVLVDVGQGKEIHRWAAHDKSMVDGLAFSPDGKYLASVGDDKWVKVWNLEKKKLRRKTKLSHVHVVGISYDRTGRRIIVNDLNKVGYYDSRTLRRRRRFKVPVGNVWALAVSPDNSLIATSAPSDGKVRIWDRRTRKARLALESHQGLITGLAFSHDGRMVASASRQQDGAPQIWDVQRGTRTHLVKQHGGESCSVAFSRNNRHLFVGHGGAGLSTYDLSTGKLTRVGGFQAKPIAFGFRGDELVVVADAGAAGSVSRWSLPEAYRAGVGAAGSRPGGSGTASGAAVSAKPERLTGGCSYCSPRPSGVAKCNNWETTCTIVSGRLKCKNAACDLGAISAHCKRRGSKLSCSKKIGPIAWEWSFTVGSSPASGDAGLEAKPLKGKCGFYGPAGPDGNPWHWERGARCRVKGNRLRCTRPTFCRQKARRVNVKRHCRKRKGTLRCRYNEGRDLTIHFRLRE